MINNIEVKASMCLNCKNKPCSKKGCPLNNDIPSFISAIKEGDYKKAYDILCETTVLPAICGRICPHYKQCMGSCVRGIKGDPVNIGDLEAFVGDIAIKEGYKIEKIIKQSKNVAIIGGGPAGLTAAAFLARTGNSVTIYEKYNYLGGLLIHGIPEFRLPREIIKKSIDKILELGIDVKYNQELGRNLDLKELEKKYDNIILAFGANISSKINIEGESLKGVFGANELLEYNNHPNYEGKIVVVNGGGNVAMDAARTIKRLGAKKVIVVYRRAREQMPAEQKEIEDAINEDVEFLFQHNIKKIVGEKHVQTIEVIKTELIEKQGETRPIPVEIENSNYFMNVDYIVMAIGSRPADFIKNIGLELNEKGYIKVDKNGLTSNPEIYAIGDLSGNISTIAWAAKSGREVAKQIDLT
ncbi:MAG: FAD-dependent oxidoreductase [Clostridia bacterium]|nr:FAD-dependent oxidoreductase [Clostridia bacterium]